MLASSHCLRSGFAALVLASMAGGCRPAPVPGASLPPTLRRRLPARGPLIDAMDALRRGDLEQASQGLNKALSNDPRRPDLHFLNAYVYERQGRMDLAEVGYQLVLEHDRSHWLAAHRLARLHFSQGRFREAQDMASQALLAAPDRPEPAYALAAASYLLADPVTAQATLARIPNSFERPRDLRLARAMVAAALGDDDTARAHIADYRSAGAPAWAVRAAHHRVGAWQALHEEGAAHGGGADPEAVETKTATVTPPKMFVVDAVIISRERSRSSRHGLNLLSALQVQFGASLVDAARGVAKDLTTGAFTSFQESANHSLSITVPAVTYSLNIANAQNSQNEILARPSVLAYDGEESEVFVGNEITYTTSGQLSGASFSKEVGLHLKVLPTRTEDNTIRMNVESQFDVFQPTAAPGSFDQAVATVKNRNRVTAELRLGQTIAIAAGTLSRTAKVREGVPVLRDLPIIQYLFSTESEVEQKTSILVLLTPRLPLGQSALSDSDPPRLRALKRRFAHWWAPTNNTYAALSRLDDSEAATEFRRGDFQFADAQDENSRLDDLLQDVADLLYY